MRLREEKLLSTDVGVTGKATGVLMKAVIKSEGRSLLPGWRNSAFFNVKKMFSVFKLPQNYFLVGKGEQCCQRVTFVTIS